MAARTGRLRLHLDLDVTSGPIQGQLALGDGSPQAFFGWMQLSQVIDCALTQARVDVRGEKKTNPERRSGG